MPTNGSVIIALLVLCCVSVASASQDAGDASARYVIGPKDTIEVTVWRHPDLSLIAMVPQGGAINMPLIGRIQAGGLTCEDLATSISKAYSPDYVKDAQVVVNVRDYKSKKVFVYGQVPRPGTYYLKADSSLREVLSYAGGVAQTGKAREVVVVRNGERVATADLNKLLVEGAASEDVPLQPGDTIFVPFNAENAIHVIGQVHRPGPIVIDDNERATLLTVISKAGGPTDRADLKDAVLIRSDGAKVPLRLDELIDRAKTEHDMPLQRGDTVLIPEELENQIYVLGDVKSPGLYTVRGHVTLTRAISLAGGATDSAKTSKTQIVRRGEKEPIIQTVDLTRIIRNGDTSLDVELQPKDIVFVPKSRLGRLGAWFGQFSPTLMTVLGVQQTIVFTKYLTE